MKKAIRNGFTLMELMICVAIVAILATAAVPIYRITIENQRINGARDALRSIYAGQRVHSSMNSGAYVTNGDLGSMQNWRDLLHMDDPTPADGSVTFVITNPTATTWTATARRVGGSNNGETLTINQDRVEGGNWTP